MGARVASRQSISLEYHLMYLGYWCKCKEVAWDFVSDWSVRA